MKIIIAGSRLFADKNFLYEQMDQMYSNGNFKEVVCGMAIGADSLGRAWAIDKKIPVKEFPANWQKYGKRAGILRNQQMADYADLAVLFWDYKSKGTENMLYEMSIRIKPVTVIPVVIPLPVHEIKRKGVINVVR